DLIRDRNQLRHDQCHFIDVVPTLVDLAGGSPRSDGGPPWAGHSIAAAFQKDGAAPRDFLYFNHNNNRAIRAGDWKLISTGQDGPWELYDLSGDRSEQHDLAAAHSDRVKDLAALWKSHDDEYTRMREAAPATAKQRM